MFRKFSHRDRRSDAPPQSVPPRNGHNPHPSVQGTPPPPTNWSPPSGPTHRPGPSYSVQGGHSRQGNAPHGDSHSRHDNAYPGGFRRPDNSTPPSGNHPIAQTNSFSYAQPVSQTSARQNEARNLFAAIDQNGDGALSQDELCSALLTNRYTRFSSDTVRYLMNTFDQNGDGVITPNEFGPLWDYMNEWIQMFDHFDQNRDGRISTSELGRALGRYDLHVTREVLEMVMEKYGDAPPRFGGVVPAPHMDLDQFVSACIGVRKMCDLHRNCSPRMGRDAFLIAILSLP
ncbi:hypothetical protein DFH94DRAFT_782869 [Russula ochroleuca]|uniref:EF-hand domain-containing protein n=1 Tax=Russula ochroleuca TaxID=152965 RepID=A0A9P5JW35_9AGAM|nr:hypothetical protein DFH94DRAFT_782869 [Russula ochroleuca]